MKSMQKSQLQSANLFAAGKAVVLVATILMVMAFHGEVQAQLRVRNSANATLMQIAQNGNVGIGTTSPATKLDVNGQVKISGGSPAAGKVLTSDAAGLGTWQALPSSGVGGSGTATRVAFWGGTAGAASTTLSSNANLYWDNTNSRLGIGQTNPSGSLGIASHAGNEIYISGTGTANIFSQGVLDLAAGSGSTIQMRSNNNAAAALQINTTGELVLGAYNTNNNFGTLRLASYPESYITTADNSHVNAMLVKSGFHLELHTSNLGTNIGNINFRPGDGSAAVGAMSPSEFYWGQNVRVGTLAGSGDQMVIADNSGVLKKGGLVDPRFRIEFYGGAMGFHDDFMRASSPNNGMAGRNEIHDGLECDYARSVKTHPYWETLEQEFLMTHGESRTMNIKYTLQKWSGSAWTDHASHDVSISVTSVGGGDVRKTQERRWMWDLAGIANGTSIRMRMWITWPSGKNDDNSWTAGIIQGIHSTENSDHLHL